MAIYKIRDRLVFDKKETTNKEDSMKTAQKIRSKTGAYSLIIQINVPIRFYWDTDNNFDGIEFGPFERPVPRYQLKLIDEALDAMCKLMGIEPEIKEQSKSANIKIPKPFLDAFKKKGDYKGG